MSTRVRVLATAILTVAATAVGTASATAASAGVWGLSDVNSASDSGYAALAVSGTANGWAVGDATVAGVERSTVKRWDGNRWLSVPAPTFGKGTTASGLSTVATLSKDNTWAAGAAEVNGKDVAVTAHWLNGHWYTRVLPAGSVVLHVSALSATNVWFLGWQHNGSRILPAGWHWNGTTWTTTSLPALVEYGSSDTFYAAAHALTAPYAPVLLHYSAGRWVLDRGPKVALRKGAQNYYFSGVVRRSATDVTAAVSYAAGEGSSPGLDVYHFNGHTWSHTWGSANGSARALCSDGSGGVWLLDEGTTDRLVDVRGTKVVAVTTVPRFGKNTLQATVLALHPGSHIVWSAGVLYGNATSHAAVAGYRR